MATTEFHIATSRCLLEQAEREYRAGDVLQASEKGWGAAAHAVKAIAEGRGWEHDRHGHLFRAARRIPSPFVIPAPFPVIPAPEPEPKVWDLFHVASAQHQNVYEGWLDDEDVEEGLGKGAGVAGPAGRRGAHVTPIPVTSTGQALTFVIPAPFPRHSGPLPRHSGPFPVIPAPFPVIPAPSPSFRPLPRHSGSFRPLPPSFRPLPRHSGPRAGIHGWRGSS